MASVVMMESSAFEPVQEPVIPSPSENALNRGKGGKGVANQYEKG